MADARYCTVFEVGVPTDRVHAVRVVGGVPDAMAMCGWDYTLHSAVPSLHNAWETMVWETPHSECVSAVHLGT